MDILVSNEPGTSFDSVTHIVELKESTRQDNARLFFDGKVIVYLYYDYT